MLLQRPYDLCTWCSSIVCIWLCENGRRGPYEGSERIIHSLISSFWQADKRGEMWGKPVRQCRANIYPQDQQQNPECKSLSVRDQESQDPTVRRGSSCLARGSGASGALTWFMAFCLANISEEIQYYSSFQGFNGPHAFSQIQTGIHNRKKTSFVTILIIMRIVAPIYLFISSQLSWVSGLSRYIFRFHDKQM